MYETITYNHMIVMGRGRAFRGIVAALGHHHDFYLSSTRTAFLHPPPFRYLLSENLFQPILSNIILRISSFISINRPSVCYTIRVPLSHGWTVLVRVHRSDEPRDGTVGPRIAVPSRRNRRPHTGTALLSPTSVCVHSMRPPIRSACHHFSLERLFSPLCGTNWHATLPCGCSCHTC